MSIGLLTFHRQLNYGGVLQALALHDTLSEISGHHVETIDLWLNPRDTPLLGKIRNPNIPLISRLSNTFKARKRPFGRKEFEERRAKTRELIESRLCLSKKHYRTSADLQELPAYETVVVGSDQVWNYDLLNAFKVNPWLMIDAPQTQDRCAYAASFGVTQIPRPLQEVYGTALRNFRAVTVREASGCALFHSLTGLDVGEPVLDPTLLRSREQWEQEIAERPTPSNYLLCYWLDDLSQERLAWLRTVSQRTGLPVVLLASGPARWLPEGEDWLSCRFDADPLDFVALIARAQGIVTDSFHGLQFATIFRRPIVCYVPPSVTGNSASARFHDFCARYGVPGVCQDIAKMYASTDVPFVPLAERVDSEKLERDRAKSLERLRAMLVPVL